MAKHSSIRLLLLAFLMIHFAGYSQYKKKHWEDRNQWQKTPKLIELMGINSDMKVADIGCHEGYMTIHLSDFLKNGKVYAVDVVKSRIDKLKTFLEEEKRNNVIPIVGKYDDPLLPKNTLDAVIIMDTYHEIDAYKKVLKKVYASLKKGGKLLILEEIKIYRINDSRKDQTKGHDIALRYVKKDLVKAGFTIEIEIPDFGRWENKEEEQMWILVAKK